MFKSHLHNAFTQNTEYLKIQKATSVCTDPKSTYQPLETQNDKTNQSRTKYGKKQKQKRIMNPNGTP